MNVPKSKICRRIASSANFRFRFLRASWSEGPWITIFAFVWNNYQFNHSEHHGEAD